MFLNYSVLVPLLICFRQIVCMCARCAQWLFSPHWSPYNLLKSFHLRVHGPSPFAPFARPSSLSISFLFGRCDFLSFNFNGAHYKIPRPLSTSDAASDGGRIGRINDILWFPPKWWASFRYESARRGDPDLCAPIFMQNLWCGLESIGDSPHLFKTDVYVIWPWAAHSQRVWAKYSTCASDGK